MCDAEERRRVVFTALASRHLSHRVDEHECETAARTVRARGANPCGPEQHWHASAAGDANAEHDIYDDDAICDYPQSGERILGAKQFAVLAESSSRQAVGFQRPANSRKR